MENITVVDVGSHTLKAGLPYNFPSFDDPTVVRRSSTRMPRRTKAARASNDPAIMLLQVTPSYVMPVADPGLAPNGKVDAALQPVMDRGLVVNWEGLEALLHDVLYGEVLMHGFSLPACMSLLDRQAGESSLSCPWLPCSWAGWLERRATC